MCAKKFDATRRSISELFRSSSNVKFKIPPYQRDYSWTKKTIEQMWADLISSFEYIKDDHSEDNVWKAEYFFGNIVLVEEDSDSSNYFIVDGQQRFATLALLLCSARDIMNEENRRTSRAYHDIRRTLANHTVGSRDTWKLELNDTDKHIFKKLLDGDEILDDDQETASQKKIYKCYQILKKSLNDEWQDDFDEEEQALHVLDDNQAEQPTMLDHFIDHVLTNNYVAEIVVAHNGNPHQIFEALNGKGQPLTQANRTKNYVLGEVKDDKDQTQMITKQWNKIFNNVVTKGLTADQFLLESFQSRYKERMKLNNICSIIKRKVSGKTVHANSDTIGCELYVNELQEDAEFLSTLNNSNAPISIRTDIEAISLLGAKLVRIPILAAHRQWPEQDYRFLVRFLVRFFFKYKTIRRRHAGQVEKIMLNTAKRINDGYTLSKIIETLRYYDNHKEFLHSFKEYADSIGKPSIAKYVLRSIDHYLATENNKFQYVSNYPADNFLLERILPSNHSRWIGDDFLDISDSGYYGMNNYVSSLGNLTLLVGNLPIKGDTFANKRSYYDKSLLAINKLTVSIHSQWTANVIKKRQQDFIKYADKIWKLD